MLREVKYLEIRGGEDIPDAAGTLYSKNETFRTYTANLDLTVNWYNKIRDTILEVEYPLIETQLQDIDAQLEKAEKSLDWEKEGECCDRMFSLLNELKLLITIVSIII